MVDCNEAASARLTSGLIRPLATFREAPPATTAPDTPAPYFKDESEYPHEEMSNRAASNVYTTKTEKRESGVVDPRALSSGSERGNIGVWLPILLLLPSLLFAT